MAELSILDGTGVTWLAHAAAAMAAALMTYVCCHPVLSFARRGWNIRREDVFNSLSKKAKMIYLESFLNQSSTQPEVDFEAMYNWRYGRYRLITPVLLLALVLLPLSFLVAERAVAAIAAVNRWPIISDTAFHLISSPGLAVAAIIGAYIWIVAALIQANASYNLQPATVLLSVTRLIAAVPMGYAVASLANKGIGPFIAFAIGAFPLNTLQVFLQRIATKQLNLDMSTDQRGDQVTQLSGVDPSIADRLQNADISTVPQLAYCDPVQLSMRTDLGFAFVLDLAGQSLAWIYLGSKLEALRPLGLRGAVEVRNLLDALASSDGASRQAAEATFAAAALAAGIDPPSAFRNVCNEIAQDPYTLFIYEVWDDSDMAALPPPTA